jgi:hypothetical protein
MHFSTYNLDWDQLGANVWAPSSYGREEKNTTFFAYFQLNMLDIVICAALSDLQKARVI